MGKAIAGAALLGVGAGVLALATGGVSLAAWAAVMSSSLPGEIIAGMLATGLSMETGAIAGALTASRGTSITTRQAAANRQIIYGQQRVGGVFVYKSTTGSHKDQFNFVIVIAGHEVHSIQNLYLDGRQVHWLGSGPGYSVRNGVGFGGVASSGTYTGPDGLSYNFGGTGHSGLYCEARYGDQLPGDVIAALTTNDPNWAASGSDSPWLGGCTYVYLKIEANSTLFPGEPEIRFTVNGKNDVYDPRTGTRGFTSNWALIAADVITDPVFGLGDSSVNQAQLIAAANVCDEQVALGVAPGTLTEARYTTNYHYDTSVAPGDVLATMLPGAGGRLSRIGGEWFLWPAYWQGPSFTFDENDITSDVQWKPYRSVRDLINRVNGTYIAPTYPYNIAGNLYDNNGWYNGQLQNNFPFAFQPTSYPQYAADSLHGYASDEWLNEDGGIPHPLELALPTVMSVSQAQRVAKIKLLRNRRQGSGTFDMALKAFAMQPTDVMSLSFAANGWSGKTLEVTGVSFKVDSKDNGAPSVRCSINVIETDSSVYEWSTAEELTVYDVPASPVQTPRIPAAPTNLSLLSGAGTALRAVDGTVTPRIEVQWDTPFDILTKEIQIQYQETGGSVWLSAPSVDVSLNLGFIANIIAGQTYNVRIRSARANGVFSDWEEIDGFTASITFSTSFGIEPVAPGVLIGEVPTAGNAQVIVPTFVATHKGASVTCLPFGEYIISGLLENTLYYVYYVDADFVGGSIVPIATTSTSDFLGKVGYYLIDAIKTPGFIAGSGNFSPANFNELGNSTTQNPTFAADGYLGSVAVVNSRTGVTSGTPGTLGKGQWLGFPNTALAYDTQVKITATVDTIENAPCTIVGSINGIDTTLLSTTVSVPQATYLLSVPRNTNLSSISVTITSNGAGGTLSGTAFPVTVTVSEIYIPYVGNTGTPGSDNTMTQPIVYTGLSSNLIPNGNFILGNLNAWLCGDASMSYGSGGLIKTQSGDGAVSATFGVIPGQKYRLSFTGKVNGAGTQNVYHRLSYSPTYTANTAGTDVDFMSAGSLSSTLTTYTYDWICPSGAAWASLQIYELGTAPLLYVNVAAQDYGAATDWGADKTSNNTSRDTVYVNGVPSSSISPIAGLMPLETGADKTKNHVLTTSIREPIEDPNGSYVLMRYGTLSSVPAASSSAYTVADYSVIVNDPSDVFNLYAVIQCSGTPGSSGYPQALGYVDCPVVVGTAPYYGGAPPSTSTYTTFGFGAGTGNCTFAGTVTGLSIGSHTLSVIFMNYTPYNGNPSDTGNAYLFYVSSYLVQVSS